MRVSTTHLRWLFLTGLLVALSGCTSVPLRTMWKLHDFGPGDFAALDPQVLRVAIDMEQGCSAGGAILKLSLRPEGSDQARRFEFDLIPAVADAVLETPGGKSGFWRLAPADLPVFRRMQRLIAATHKQRHKMTFSFNAQATHLHYAGGMMRAVHLSIYLRLAPDQAYLTLLDNAVLPAPQATNVKS